MVGILFLLNRMLAYLKLPHPDVMDEMSRYWVFIVGNDESNSVRIGSADSVSV